MAVDANLIASIGDNTPKPADAMERGIGIKDMLDRNQLNKLALTSAQTEAAEGAQIKDALKGTDLSTPEGVDAAAAKVNRINPRAALDIKKQAQSYQSGQVQMQLDQLTIADKRQEMIVGALDPIVAQARQMKNNGASELEVKAFITQQMPQAIQQLRGVQMPDGKPAIPDDQLKMVTNAPGGYSLATLEGWESKSKAGQAAIRQRLEQLKADTAQSRELESERHNRATEGLGNRKETRAERDTKGNLNPEAVDLAAQRLVNGEQPRDVLANFGRGKQGAADIAAVQNRFAQMAKDQGLQPDEIALRVQEMRGSARAELALGEREGKIAPRVQEAKRFAEIALKASENLPRGDWKGMNKVQQWITDQASGKELGRFQAANVSLINAYAAAIGGGQIHQHDQEVGANLLSTANGPENYKAKVEQLITETETALAAPEEVKEQWRETRAREAERRSGRTEQSSPAGGGGPGTPRTDSPPSAGGPLKPGSKYQHASGATVEILPDGS